MTFDKSTITSLSKRLNLPLQGNEQDWPIELSDSKRLLEFLDFFKANALNNLEKKAVVTLILASYEDLLSEKTDVNQVIWKEIIKILEIGAYNQILMYWADYEEENTDNSFLISPLVRDYLEK
jgi:hypothetical protein